VQGSPEGTITGSSEGGLSKEERGGQAKELDEGKDQLIEDVEPPGIFFNLSTLSKRPTCFQVSSSSGLISEAIFPSSVLLVRLFMMAHLLPVNLTHLKFTSTLTPSRNNKPVLITRNPCLPSTPAPVNDKRSL
jgi:hypothetical protein